MDAAPLLNLLTSKKTPDTHDAYRCRRRWLLRRDDVRCLSLWRHVLRGFFYARARHVCVITPATGEVWHRDARRGRAARRHFAVSLARGVPGVQVVHGGVLHVLGDLLAGRTRGPHRAGEMWVRCLVRCGKEVGL